MKVILQSDVKKLGSKGDLVDVAEGYARNFLIPRGLAVEANAANMKHLKATKAQEEAKLRREEEAARQLAADLQKQSVRLYAKQGESGRLFGSITAGDIADALKKAGFEVDRRKIELDEPIKSIGRFNVAVVVYPGITATVQVDVTADPGDAN